VVVRYPLADRDWAVRHVLQYGEDAVVLAPATVQRAVLAVLDRLAGEEGAPGRADVVAGERHGS
jgi:predicted DNA-binding transcriptional regulator YafY